MEAGTLKFSWKIKNFSKLREQYLYSDVSSLGPYKWKILAYPKGYYEDNHLTVSLVVADSETLPSGWSRKAKFNLTVINQIDNKSSVTRVAEHEFKENNNSWGFPSFISRKELHDPNEGYLVDDTCIIEADVTICGDDLVESKCMSKETNEEDMDGFFADLNSVFFPKKVVSLEEEAKQAMTMIEESLNLVPADLNNPSRLSELKNAFDILSSLDDCFKLTSEQKAELVSLKDNLIDLSKRAAQAVRDKKLFTEKELVKKTLDHKLERCLIKFERAKAEMKQNEQDIAILLEQIGEKTRKKEDSALKQKETFKQSKELKAELNVLVKHWPVYEARMNAAEEEEKVVDTEWSKMKQLFSSLKKPFY